ncbi:MAG: hypothetical protein AABY99_09145 [Pseudomonadota bacterium]
MKQSSSIESEQHQTRYSCDPVGRTSPVRQAFADNRESTAIQRQLMVAMANSPQAIMQRLISQRIHSSPRVLAQRKILSGISGESVQRVEEESLQGKFATKSPAQLKQQSFTKSNNTGLPDNLKSGIKSRSDISMNTSQQTMQLKALSTRSSAASNAKVMQFTVLTRSMWKIVNDTKIGSEEEYYSVGNFLKSKGYGDDVIKEILNRIVEKSKYNLDTDVFSGYSGKKKDVFDDSDEVGINVVDHGDLNEYDNPTAIDDYLKTNLGIVQMARKGNTVSGPKDYSTHNFGDFKKVAYTTDAKGSIDFTSPTQKGTWSNPVYGGSLVNLSTAGKTIDKKNRPQHFALGDYLYAKQFGKKASATTNLRKGKWTWHHLPTQYQMVLVDMTVHAKHGHNGGVYLW